MGTEGGAVSVGQGKPMAKRVHVGFTGPEEEHFYFGSRWTHTCSRQKVLSFMAVYTHGSEHINGLQTVA